MLPIRATRILLVLAGSVSQLNVISVLELRTIVTLPVYTTFGTGVGVYVEVAGTGVFVAVPTGVGVLVERPTGTV